MTSCVVYDKDAEHNLGLDMAAASSISKQTSASQDKDVAAAVSDAEASVQSLILKQQTEVKAGALMTAVSMPLQITRQLYTCSACSCIAS